MVSERLTSPPGRGAAARGRRDPLERRVEASLAALLPDYPDVALCVAFSGGLDSTVLLAALALRASRNLKRRGAHGPPPGSRSRTSRSRTAPRLRAVHIDHGLQPRSGAWAAHCRAFAARLGIPLTVIRIEVPRPRGASLEAAARDARYAALAAELGEREVLLTAQHSDDQLETVLLQLMRGAGPRGLAAMPAVAPFARGRLARPLLACERAEIEAWARDRALDWVEDATNDDERLDRNYLRRRVTPLLRARWPAAARAASRSAGHAAEAQRLLELLARADAERAAVGDALSVKRLRTLPPERRRNALRYWIARSGVPLPDARRLQELSGSAIEARADAHPEVAWGPGAARREGDRLRLVSREHQGPPRAADAAPLEASRALSIDWTPYPDARSRGTWQREAAVARKPYSARKLPPGRRTPAVLELPAGLGRLELTPDPHGPIDLDALPMPLSVSLRRGGERLRPRRGGPSRALKALLQEAHIPRGERASLPLLWSGERLLAAGDLWVDAAIRSGAATRRRGRLIWHRDPHIC